MASASPVSEPSQPPLSAEQVEEFFSKGFVHIPSLFSNDEIDVLSKEADRLYSFAMDHMKPSAWDNADKHDTNSKPYDTKPANTESVLNDTGARYTFQNTGASPTVRHIAWAGLDSPELDSLGHSDKILSIAAQLLRASKTDDHVVQLINQVHYKFPNDGVAFPWHQDSHHRGLARGEFVDVNGSGSYVQIVVAIDNVTEDNGPLRFIPYSCQQGHIGGTDGLDPSQVDASKAVAPLLKAGDAVAFGPYTIHGSLPNTGQTPRRAFINGFSSAGANKKIKVHEATRSVKHLLFLATIACMFSPGLSTGCERWPLPVTGTIRPKPSANISSSFLSVGAETMDREFTNFSEFHQRIGQLGAKHARIQLGWARTEPTMGNYSFTWLDTIIEGLARQGITPWAQFSFGNPAYPGGGTREVDSPLPMGALPAWTRFVNETVHRYKDIISEWEVWNEPDLHIPVKDYQQLYLLTAETVLNVQSQAKLYLQIAHDIDYANATLLYVQQHARHILNSTHITYHPYSYNPDDTYSSYVPELLNMVKSFSPSMRIFQGENGAPSVGSRYGALSNYNWTQFSQAKWALRRLFGDLGYCDPRSPAGIESSIFSIIDMCYDKDINTKGLIQADCHKDAPATVIGPKHAFRAVQTLASLLGANAMPDCEAQLFDSNMTKSHTFRAFRLADSETTLVALWLSDQTPADYNLTDCHDCCKSVTLKVAGLVPARRNASHSAYVLVDAVNGLVYDLPSASVSVDASAAKLHIEPMPLYDSPMILALKSALLPLINFN